MRRAETLIDHVQMKAIDVIFQHLGQQIFQVVAIARVVTQQIDGLALMIAHAVFRMLFERVAAIL